MRDNYNLIKSLQVLRDDLIKNIYCNSPLNAVSSRVSYYSIILNSTVTNNEMCVLPLLKKPDESCLGKLLRLLLTNNPNPYHFDFYTTSQVNQVKSMVVHLVKLKFGSSHRLTQSWHSKSISLKYVMISPVSYSKDSSGSKDGDKQILQRTRTSYSIY